MSRVGCEVLVTVWLLVTAGPALNAQTTVEPVTVAANKTVAVGEANYTNDATAIIAVCTVVAVFTFVLTVICLCYNNKKKKEHNAENGAPLVWSPSDIPGPGVTSFTDLTLEKDNAKNIEAGHIVEEVTVTPIQNEPGSEVPERPPKAVKLTENPIRSADLGAYIDRQKATQGAFQKEFVQIPSGQTKPWETGVLQANYPKNQFINIIAYDDTRVVLKSTDNKPGKGYINANRIPGYGDSGHSYIATQGPKDNTIGDFWEMVWQEGISRILMLTNVKEGDKVKCSQYWPSEKGGTGAMYGLIVVKMNECFEFADYTIRNFSIKHESQDLARLVTQYHFTDWPDHDVPAASAALLDLRLKVRATDDTSRGPLLLHCSAGVGRTGTFIAIDYSLDKAEAEGVVDVYALVRRMRECRVNMIQTLMQYIFVHDSLRLILEPGFTAVPRHCITEAMSTLHQRSGDRGTRLQRQYRCLEVCRDLYNTADLDGCSKENISKNRSTDVVPREQFRPALAVNGHFTSDYINAAYVNSYLRPLPFVVTQWPLPETIPDVWRMLYDHQSCALVLLNGLDLRDETCRLYWPASDDEPLVFGALRIELKTQDVKDGLVLRTFRITDLDRSGEEASMLVEQFHLTTWAATRDLPHSMDSFCALVGMLVAWRREHIDGVITVQCRSGVKQSGLLLAALYLLEKLHFDGELDVPLAVSQIRKTRPQLIESHDQYAFLYEFARSYIKLEDRAAGGYFTV